MNTVNFKKTLPERVLNEKSAWRGLESILAGVIEKYDIGTDSALEFGVEFGYSTIALSNYFDGVTGVDTFTGDEHAGHKDSLKRATKNCAPYTNIFLVQADYKDYIKEDTKQYDLIHIDIVHNYDETYECGKWAMEHADLVIFHDTESFPEVKRAVHDLSNGTYDNYPYHYGLGIIDTRSG